jgi:hypothetical protein
MGLKVIVIGDDESYDVQGLLDALHDDAEIELVVHRGLSKPEREAVKWTFKVDIDHRAYPPELEKHGDNAWKFCNQKLVDKRADIVLAFGETKDVMDMIKRATKASIRVEHITERVD